MLPNLLIDNPIISSVSYRHAIILKATFSNFQNFRIPNVHRTSDLGFAMILDWVKHVPSIMITRV